MRWERLFDDLEGEVAEMAALERDAEISERVRAEVSAVRLLERLRGSRGATIAVEVMAVGPIRGVVRYVGPDWLLLDDSGRDVLVPAGSVVSVEGAGRSAPVESGRVPLTWAAAWRSLARDRARVHLVRLDGTALRGSVGQVGADFIEIEGTGEWARTRLVPFAGIAVAHTAREGDR